MAKRKLEVYVDNLGKFQKLCQFGGVSMSEAVNLLIAEHLKQGRKDLINEYQKKGE